MFFGVPMSWAPLLVTVFLACFGWFLIARLAQNREAYDLYTSLVSLVEKLGEEGTALWQSEREKLNQQEELRLKLRLAELEQRLGIIRKHYSHRKKTEIVTSKQIWQLRHYLTVAPIEYLLGGSNVSRENGYFRGGRWLSGCVTKSTGRRDSYLDIKGRYRSR